MGLIVIQRQWKIGCGLRNKAKSVIKKALPRNTYQNLRRLITYGPSDLRASLLHRRPDLVPPARLVYVGGSDFVEAGNEFLEYFKNLTRVNPNSKILDVGSGIGRMARPFTRFLGKDGRYCGFEVDTRGVKWCQQNISRRFPNFEFVHADIANSEYNPSGTLKANEYCFPYKDSTFDLVFLTSVFTHMLPSDTEHYLHEIQRVLASNGQTLITWFIQNEESAELQRQGQAAFTFERHEQGFYCRDPVYLEAAVGYDQGRISDMYQQSGLEVERICWGSWCGRQDYVSFQDIVVAGRKT